MGLGTVGGLGSGMPFPGGGYGGASPRRGSVGDPYTSVVRLQSPPKTPGARSATPPMPPRSAPAFLSPTQVGGRELGGRELPRLKEAALQSPRVKDVPLQSPRRSPSAPRTPRARQGPPGISGPQDLVDTFASGQGPDKNKTLFEIQHLLVSRSKEELEGIVKSLRH